MPVWLLALLTVVLGVLGPMPVRAADRDGGSDEAHARAMREAIREVVNHEVRAGMSVALLQNGRIAWVEGFGWADRRRQIPASADTTYRVGSVSKMFVALAALRLQARGQLDVDAPLPLDAQGYFDNGWADDSPVHLAHLLEHTSGFDEMRFNEIVAPDGADLSPHAALSVNPRSRVTRWRPGERHAYAQTGYTLAARVLEQASGRDFDRLVREEVVEPLHLQSATFESRRGFGPSLAVGYADSDDAGVVPFSLAHRAAGNLFVSARDLARVLEMLMARGSGPEARYLPEALVHRMESGSSSPYSRYVRTYGLGNYPTPWNGGDADRRERWQGHGGWMPGYQTTVLYNPRTGDGVVVLSNDTHDDASHWRIATMAVDAFERRHPPPPPPPEADVPLHRLRPLAGQYRFIAFSAALLAPMERLNTRELALDSTGQLWLDDPRSGREALVPVTEHTFRRAWEDRASIVVYTDADGRSVLHDTLGFGSYRREALVVTLGVRMWCQTTSAVAAVAMLWPLGWIALVLIRRAQGKPRPRICGLWLWPTAAAWCLSSMLHVLFGSSPTELAQPGAAALMVFGLGWTGAVTTVVGTIHAVQGARKLSRSGSVGALRWLCAWSLVANVVQLSLVLYFARDGLVGLRTWLW